MKIRLNEIPEDGRSYTLNRKTAELNSVLLDLVKNADYDIDLYIKPINTRDFALNGLIKTHTVEQCSLCADEFNFDVKKNVREILIPEPEPDRTGKYAKSSVTLNTEDGDELSVSHYKSSQFDLGEFVHESIAIEVPFNPICAVCLASNHEKPFIYDEKISEEVKANPFEALKNIKLN